MTAEIIPLDDRRPHRTERVYCGHCGTRWQAVFPADIKGALECPHCRRMAGAPETPTDGDAA